MSQLAKRQPILRGAGEASIRATGDHPALLGRAGALSPLAKRQAIPRGAGVAGVEGVAEVGVTRAEETEKRGGASGTLLGSLDASATTRLQI